MQNRDIKTKAVVEAGLLSAIIVIIALINAYFQIFSVVGAFILPLPVTILYLRHNYKVATASVICSCILVAVLYDPITAIASAIMYGLIGMVLGYCIKKKKKFSTIMMLLAVVSAVSMVLNIEIYTIFIDKTGIIGQIKQMIDAMKESIKVFKTANADKQTLDMINSMEAMLNVEFFMKLLPGILIIASFISAYVNYIITISILKKLKYEITEVTPFSNLYIDNRVAAIFIILICFGLVLQSKKIGAGDFIFYSAFYLAQTAFIFDGMALVTFYLRNRFRVPKTAVVFILIFTYLTPLNSLYFYLGILDIVLDFRKLDPNRIFKWRKNS